MTDLYAKCPCGSGKKIKFCCRDIITDLEKIERMIRGEQRNAAADKINKLLEKHPGRPALLNLKAVVHLDLQQLDEAQSTVSTILEADPDNPSGLAIQAILLGAQGEIKPALAVLHKSLRCSEGYISQSIYRAYLSLCILLVQVNEIIAAYAHLLTLVAMTKGEDESTLSLLVQVTSSEKLPAIFYGVTLSMEAPEDASWKREFDLAMKHYHHGDWTSAAELFKDMNRRILDEPILLRNQAILDVWTCDLKGAVKAFHTLAVIREVEEDVAVEAEACAQVLERTHEDDSLEWIAISIDLDDAERVMETLLSQSNARSLNPEKAGRTDGPPPKGLFVWYDRDIPKDDNAALELVQLPRELCTVMVYGKETDKAARLNIILPRDEQSEELLSSIGDALGIAADANLSEAEVVMSLHKMQHVLRPRFWIPDGTSVQQLREYQQAWCLNQIHHVWPDLKLAFLDGKTPREAAQVRKLKRKVLASILNLEIALEQDPVSVDFNQLRRELGLPEAHPIDPAGMDIRRLSPVQVSRLELEKLSLEALVQVFETVSVRRAGKTMYRVGIEILRRGEDATEHIDLVEVRTRLAEAAPTSDESLEHLAAARDLAVAEGESPAPWLISELDQRLQRQELDIAQRLIIEIQTRYVREPGVAQMFARVLAKFGLMPTAPDASQAAAVSQAPIPAEVGAAAAPHEAPAGVWTPDAPATPSSPSGDEAGESKIWMPGMD